MGLTDQVLRVGLTGGIGAGKSTVARLLSEHGALVVDADQLAREVVARDTPGLAAVVAQFGPGMVGPDGELDRQALGAVVFNDPRARSRLEGIIHPLVRRRTAALVAAAPATAVVVNDVPLLLETGQAGSFDLVIVVQSRAEARLARLCGTRGMSQAEALARIGAQATDEQRRAIADIVIENNGGLEDLRRRVAAVWARLTESSPNSASRLGDQK